MDGDRKAISVAVGKKERLGPDPLVALGLAVLVAAGVFALIWRIRKTFGLKH